MLQFLLTISDEANHSNIERIYNKYHDQMMKYAHKKFKEAKRKNFAFDAEDAVQNSFFKIVKNIDRIDFSQSEKMVKNYCFCILDNEIRNLLGDGELNCQDLTDYCIADEFSFINEIEMKEAYADVVKSIESLDEKYSTTLFLVFCQEISVNEIAEMMGIAPQTVYTRLRRGKKILQDKLAEAQYDAK